jgi:hypothetical protein
LKNSWVKFPGSRFKAFCASFANSGFSWYSSFMTIEQTVEIPPSHRLTIDLPPDTPEGTADITLKVRPKTVPRERRIPLVSWFGKRQEEAKVRAIMDAAGCLKDNPVFGGDPVAYFRKERDAWDEGPQTGETKNHF